MDFSQIFAASAAARACRHALLADWALNAAPRPEGSRVLPNTAFLRGFASTKPSRSFYTRQNPSLVNRRLLGGGRGAALIDAKLMRIATVGGHRAGLVFLRARVFRRRYALQHGTVFVAPGLPAEAGAALRG